MFKSTSAQKTTAEGVRSYDGHMRQIRKAAHARTWTRVKFALHKSQIQVPGALILNRETPLRCNHQGSLPLNVKNKFGDGPPAVSERSKDARLGKVSPITVRFVAPRSTITLDDVMESPSPRKIFKKRTPAKRLVKKVTKVTRKVRIASSEDRFSINSDEVSS